MKCSVQEYNKIRDYKVMNHFGFKLSFEIVLFKILVKLLFNLIFGIDLECHNQKPNKRK